MSSQYFRFGEPGAEPQREAMLESLLAAAHTPTLIDEWRTDALSLMAPQWPVPAVAPVAFAREGLVGTEWVYLATPVHYVAELSNVRMASDGVLDLEPSQAQALAQSFAPVWHDAGVRLQASDSGMLFLLAERSLHAHTVDPQEVRGRRLEPYLPSGGDAGFIRRLMSEIEMWLFEHAVNQARRARSEPPITGLWLWGGGTAAARQELPAAWIEGHDVMFSSLAPRAALPQQASGVVVIDAEPGSAAWAHLAGCLQSAAQALRDGRLASLALSAGTRRYRIVGRFSRRWWRKRRPWWEYFS